MARRRIFTSGLFNPYPTFENLDNISEASYSAPGTTPNYLTPFTNELGYTVTRVSDSTTFGVDSEQLKPNYPTDQAWSYNGSYIKLGSYPNAILNGSTYAFLYFRNLPSDSRWLKDEPNKVIGTPSNYIYKMDVPNDTGETIYTFSSYSTIELTGKGNLSDDQRYVALLGTTGGGDKYIITFDLQTVSIIAELQIDATDLNWLSISPSGSYVILSYTTDGSGSTEGYKRYNRDLTGFTHLHNNTAHSDMGFDMQGNEVITQFRTSAETTSSRHSLETIKISDGTITPYFNWKSNANHPSENGIYAGHVSMRCSNHRGWALVTEEGGGSDVLVRELFLVPLDPNKTSIVRRWGRHNSNQSIGYAHQPHAVPNWNATKAIFTSNWDDATWETLNSGLAWVIEK